MPQRDGDIQALLDGKALADGDILQYRVPRDQLASPAGAVLAAAAKEAGSDSLGSSGSGGGAAGKGADLVLASAMVGHETMTS